jgi:hypothetical protein
MKVSENSFAFQGVKKSFFRKNIMPIFMDWLVLL